MEYQVPQFIEVEDKIFGPLSFQEFVYVAGGGGLCTIIILYAPSRIIGIILAIPVAALSLALAFYKVNNKSFTDILEAGLKFYTNDRLYLWKKNENVTPPQRVTTETVVQAPVTREKLGLSSNKLHELAWSLDIKDHKESQDRIQ